MSEYQEDTANSLPNTYGERLGGLDNLFVSNKEISKSERLQKIRDEKLAALSKQNGYAPLDNSYTQLEDGALESNSNKIWNDLSGEEFQSAFQYGLSKYALSRDEQGNLRFPNGELYEGDSRRLYLFGSKDLTNQDIKIGVAKGSLSGAEERYSPNAETGYGWASGDQGVDTSDKQLDVELPYAVATMLEGLAHGRKEALQNRSVRNRFDTPELTDSYGSGSSEYYTSKEGLFGAEKAYEEALGKGVFDAYFKGIQDRYSDKGIVDRNLLVDSMREKALRKEAESMGAVGRGVNAGKSLARTFIKETFVDLPDWIGESVNAATGGVVGWDLGTEEQKTNMLNDLVGLNPYAAEKPLQEAQKIAADIVDSFFDKNKEVDFGDVARLVKLGITTPELLGDSVGFLASFYVPILGWGGKAVKATDKINDINKAVKLGLKSKEAAKVEIAALKANVTLLDKVQKFAQQNAGLMQVSAGNVNDQIDAYKEEHGSAPSMYKVTQMFTTEALLLGLDRWSDVSILKAPAALKGVREAFTAITPNEKAKVLTKVVGVAGGLFANMGREAAQEYVQEIGQAFNVKFDYDSQKDLLSAIDEAGNVLLSKEMQTAGVLGAGLGAGGAVQFQLVGGIRPTARMLGEMLSNTETSSYRRPTPTGDAAPTEDETAKAKREYGELITRLRDDVAAGKVNSNNILSYLDDAEKLTATKHIIADSSVASVEAGEKAYNDIIDGLEKFIADNADLKLTKKITRKTVQEAVSDNRAVKALQTLPDASKTSFQAVAEALGEGEEYSFEDSVKAVQKFIGKKTYEKAVEDEEAIGPLLKNLEQALTGTVSETAKESFEKVQETLVKFSSTQTLPDSTVSEKTEEAPATVLGTGPKIIIEEGEYDDFSRVADVTRAIGIVLDARQGKVSPEIMSKMVKFARTNGVEETTLNNLIKSYESVDEEAISGNRGYATRVARIKGLLSSSNPDIPVLRKEYVELSRMVDSIENSVVNLRTGIKEVEEKAALLNKKNSDNGGGPNKTPYMKLNTKTGKYDVPFTIDIVRKDGKWVADTVIAKKNLAKKEGYLADIKKEQRIIGRRANSVAPGVVEVVGTVQIPTAVGRAKKQRTADESYLSNITKTLQTISSKFTFPNKIVLGEEPSGKWKNGQDYRKANALNINPEEFDATDVVLLNDLGSWDTKKVDSKGRKVYMPSLVTSKPDNELTPQQRSFKAAVDAGAAIVLDRELVEGSKTREGLKAARAHNAFRTYLTNRGYVSLEKEGTMAFVKPTPETAASIQAVKDSVAEQNKTHAEKKKDKEHIVSLHRAIEINIDPADGSVLSEERKDALIKEYNKLFFKVREDSFGDSNEKINKFLERQSLDEVAELATDVLNDPSPLPINYSDKALQKAVEDFIANEINADVKGKEVLAAWKDATKVQQQTGKQLEKTLATLLRSIGATPKALINDLLSSEKSFAVGKNDIYERVYQRLGKDGQIEVKVTRGEITDKLKKQFEDKKVVVLGGKSYIPITIRQVTQDATKLVQVSRTTVLNSVPIASLPFSLRDISEKFSKNVFKALARVSEAELSDQTDAKKPDGSFVDGGFFLHNSPARGIIFNKEGKPNPEVMAAMYLAIGDLLKTNKHNLLLGFKSDADIANMFNVQEHEVTQGMRDIARNNGAFVKTIASRLGSSILQQLGLSRKSGKDIAANEYEVLVADLGNSAIAIAEVQGILSTTTVSSNVIASAFRDGTQRAVETNTRFVNIKSVGKKEGKYTRQVPVEGVEQFSKGFDEVVEEFPEAVTGRKEVLFDAPTEERIAAVTSAVRNDIAGLAVPEKAKETLAHLMNTPFEYDKARVDSFLEAIDKEGSKVLELLGYVDLESDKYKNMYFKDKDVQEAKNRDIIKSVEEIRELKKVVEARGEENPSLFFDYSYIGNNRYMMDSNTINPQTDKLHRFLFVPKGASLSYSISQSNYNKGLLFTATDAAGKVTDESFSLRYSIAQALGMSVDKKKAANIIKFADVMLGLSQDHIKEIREKVLDTGEYEFTHNGEKYKIVAEHLSHALHALDTLDSIKEATKPEGTNTIQSSLISEIDSLTSGFANKLQQMPILSNMHQHFARIGILTKEFLDALSEDAAYKTPGEGFDPTKGDSIADLLEEGSNIGFSDSYQNLAGKTIAGLIDGSVAMSNLSHSAKGAKGISGIDIFESVKALFPGGGSIVKGEAAETIESDIRTLFKNPFMIFNYSASIGRITKNLGVAVANTLAKTIATTDLSDPEQAHVKQAAEDLLKSAYILDPEDKGGNSRITTTAGLQKALKETSLGRIRIKPMVITSGIKGNPRQERNLESALSSVVENTFGEVVKNVFEAEFAPFIKVQTAMNNSFKIAFRIFDYKRMEKLKALRSEKNGNPLTREDHAAVLEELWDDFPWIVGPLTGANNKGKIKDVIAVVDISTKSPNEIESARKSPQTQLGSGLEGGTRTVNPLIRYLEEAVSSGSVLPFHALDGAEISYLVNTLALEDILAVHDAILPPNSRLDEVGFTYHKGMAEFNQDNEKGYVLADAMAKLGDRIEATIKSEDFDSAYRDVTSVGLKGIKSDEVNFTQAAKLVLKDLREQINIIKTAREAYYGPNGKMEGALVGNLVSTGGAMYKKGATSPDTSYKKALEKLYTAQNVELVKDTSASLEDAYNGLTDPQKKEIVKVVRNLGVEVEKVNDLVASILNLGDKQPVVDALTKRANSVKSKENARQLDLFADAVDSSTTEVNPVDATGISEDTKKSAEVGKEVKEQTKDCS